MGGLIRPGGARAGARRFGGGFVCCPKDSSNPTTLLPQKREDSRGFQPGCSIAQVARFGERRAGERAFQDAFRLRVRQPARENRGIPATHGEEP